MAHGPATPLPALTPEDLAQVRGSGGTLDLSFTLPPVRGQVEVGRTSPRGSVAGTLSTDGRSWAAGVQASVNPSPKVNLGAFYKADGRQWEAGVSARIRFLKA
ncbi:hypothetical protein [Mesoterricola silvestris]|uniref:Uncharacterized protein n=1 Tax=Mesoterricola silvestris TaxID=2927979 RepID=A0AA48GI03_9BACT|nr:hypothetical protein [Mesoterricola silvestris]BDU71607.1 hypothetical protein METEAL_07810 [Mesoterricola silvestris]